MAAVTVVVLWAVGSLLVIGSLVVLLGPWNCGAHLTVQRRQRRLEKWYRAAHVQHRSQLIELTHACNQHDVHLQQLLTGTAAMASGNVNNNRPTSSDVGGATGGAMDTQLRTSCFSNLDLIREVQLLRQDLNQLLLVLTHKEKCMDDDPESEYEQ